MVETEWLWGIEGSFFLIMMPSGFRKFGYLSLFNLFEKINIGWPQQPLTELVLISVKNWIFYDPFHKKGTSIGHFSTRDDLITTIRKFFFDEIE